ncbi:uncharacterized protein LOC124459740 [Drosophila willistoni]|uniref:uncharacterized protein LOC124459740 n=1 Tax=Drosophila willistoni TaxID=7260 RepID=UPI001F087F13|nr:uncharacterized protein LOC124459740 [Drosophila willistoni]XP_046865301.1 uncharacterized protein LOC124459740 [Drosophila willistoni]
MLISIVSPQNDEISISTCNGDVYYIKRVLTEQMDTIKEKMAASSSPSVIPLVDTDSSTFELVMKWCALMHNLGSTLMDVETSRYMFNGFLQAYSVNQNMLLKLTLAGHRLKIRSLLEATTRRLADEIRACETTEEVRAHFGIHDAPQDG